MNNDILKDIEEQIKKVIKDLNNTIESNKYMAEDSKDIHHSKNLRRPVGIGIKELENILKYYNDS
jgi:SMC interacting uncharacterized protein involved in chromosome segregation